MTGLAFEQCYRATASRDARFDGRFIVGVRTTGIYCRPSCPSPVCPKPSNVMFFRTVAAAQLAGLRACKRCSPDAVPSAPDWNIRSDVVACGTTTMPLAAVSFGAGLALKLSVRRPFDGQGVLSWLSARAIPGVEQVTATSYRRSLRLPGGFALVTLTPREDHVQARFGLATVTDLTVAVHRCRQLFDLDAEPSSYTEPLSADAALAPLVAANPGLRVPGTVDGFETAIRAVLGQQVSVRAARSINARLVAACGTPLPEPSGSITHAFPTPEAVAGADLSHLGVPGSRRKTLQALAGAVAAGMITLDSGADRVETQRRLLSVSGIGEWTASYIALRALGDPDAFPASDLGIKRSARRLGLPENSVALIARTESWRPWRAYAAHYLWSAPD